MLKKFPIVAATICLRSYGVASPACASRPSTTYEVCVSGVTLVNPE